MTSSLLVSTAGGAITRKGAFGSAAEGLGEGWDVAVDAGGDIFVASKSTHQILKYDSDGKFLMSIGEAHSSDGSHTDDGQLYYPESIATDTAGNFLYVADTANSRVQVFSTADGAFIRKWGTPGSGDGELNGPGGIALDAQDNVYVADTLNQRIVKFTSSGTFIKAWGTSGTTDGKFIVPFGIAFNSATSTLYVTDEYIGRFQEFTLDGGFVNEFGLEETGTGYLLDHPDEITVDSIRGLVYVAEAGSQEVSIFDVSKPPNEAFTAEFDGLYSGFFGYAHGIHFNPDNAELLIAATGRQRIFRYNTLGTPKITVNRVDPDSAHTLEFEIQHNMAVGTCYVKATGTMKTPKHDPFDGETFHLGGTRAVIQSNKLLEYVVGLSNDEARAANRTRVTVKITFGSPGGCNGGVDTPKPVVKEFTL